MNHFEAQHLADELLKGRLSVDQFVQRLASSQSPGLEIADVGVAQVDLGRRRRCGFPEVVYGSGKTVEALERIFRALVDDGAEVLATRISPEQAARLGPLFPTSRYNAVARTFRVPPSAASGQLDERAQPAAQGHVVILTAGTSDLPVAEEARETADWTGARVTLVQDVGVAGPQRLLAHLAEIRQADVVVVVAGMEAALPSVVGGYVECPVVGVPTSVGYGASLGGLAAILSMLNSCAANVAVVNIDAGFKGGYLAGMIARLAARGRSP